MRLAGPIIGLNVLNVLALAVDTAMCGRLPHSDEALTALGFSTQVFFILLVAAMGMVSGAVALVARAHGAGEGKRVVHVIQQATQLTVGFGIISATVGVLLAPYILSLLGAKGVVRDQAMSYLTPMLWGSTFYYLNITFAAVLRGVGNTVLPFRVALFSNVVNAALNYHFILGGLGGPVLGLAGAAYGTVIANAVAVVLLITLLRRGVVPGVTVPLKPAALDKGLASELWAIGWPAALDMVVLNVMLASIVGMIARLDPLAVAAHGVGLRIQALAFVPGMSVMQATAAIIGQALGRGDVEEARQSVRVSRVLCAAIMSTLGLFFIAFASPMVAIFFDVGVGTVTHTHAVTWIRVLGCSMPIVGVWLAYAGLLHGSGATFTALRINATTTLLVQVPTSAILGMVLGLGPLGVWIGLPAGELLKVWLGHRAFKAEAWALTGVQVKAKK